ncbi:MAG: EVE domain-containing protein [Verrucomicrobiae bacterium]|nr:EVE domain-containing protein [Verrucomicrobiae bacterium]
MEKQIWLFVSDPDDYNFEKLWQDAHVRWDGINGRHAQKYLRNVKKGDWVVCYHTAPRKAVFGLAEVTKGAYPDPHDDIGHFVVCDLKPRSRFKKEVPLERLRGHKTLSQMKFCTIQRLSVSPVTSPELHEILKLAGEKGASAN